MINIFEEINRISLTDILDKVWVTYEIQWDEIILYEWDKHTDWWRWSISRACIKDFSGKRAEGDRITFVMAYYNIDKWQSVKWFKDKFNLSDDEHNKPQQEMIWFWSKALVELSKPVNPPPVDVKPKWEAMGELTVAQIAYLKSRAIDYNFVKRYIRNNVWYVCCPISDIVEDKIDIISIQSRDINTKKFVIEKWSSSKGCFISSIDKTKKYIYVVEWMFDFLTLAQFSDNVVWMKSAKDWADVVLQFAKKWYLPILIPDNDEAGKSMVELLKWVKTSILDLSKFDAKDINELLVKTEYGRVILEFIEEERSKEPRQIDSAFKKLKWLQSLYKTRWRLWNDGPPSLKRLTDLHQWIIEWKVYTIGWFSWGGKSTLSYEYAAYFLQQWKKVLYFSVEVDTGLLLWYIARNYTRKALSSIMRGDASLNPEHFKNLYLYDTVRSLDKISEIVNEEKPDFVFIDYAQWVKCEWVWSFEQLKNYSFWIQQLAIESNATIFSLSQVNNDSRNKDWWEVTLKWSWDLFAASDVIIILAQEWALGTISIMKNKFWKKEKFYLNIDYETWKMVIMSQAYDNEWI